MTLPRITKEVTETLEKALECVEDGDHDNALVYADLLRQGGFSSAAGRITKMVHTKPTQGDQ